MKVPVKLFASFRTRISKGLPRHSLSSVLPEREGVRRTLRRPSAVERLHHSGMALLLVDRGADDVVVGDSMLNS